MIHPAWQISFDELWNDIQKESDQKYINLIYHNAYPLVICDYSNSCQYDKHWTPVTKSCRGLVLDYKNKRIVATPYEKFHNWSELPNLPNEPFTTSTKADGSLGIAFNYNNEWIISTRGSFTSPQAIWATELFRTINFISIDPSITYLWEIIYPENRIVVDYKGWKGLILLGAYQYGCELDIYDNKFPLVTNDTHIQFIDTHHFDSIEDITNLCKTFDHNKEGFVVLYKSGLRVKIKGEEYLRVHKLRSNITPLGVWEMMLSDMDVDDIRSQLPDEFISEFDKIYNVLHDKAQLIVITVLNCLTEFKDSYGVYDRKAWALYAKDHLAPHMLAIAFCKPMLHLLFPQEIKANDEDPRKIAIKGLRPTGNIL
jgi:RNA ligase